MIVDHMLSQDIIKSYHEKGFCVIPGGLDKQLLDDLSNAISHTQNSIETYPAELQAEMVFEKDLKADERNGVASDQVGRSIFVLGDPVKFSPVFKKLLKEEHIAEIGRSLLNNLKLIFHFMNVTI